MKIAIVTANLGGMDLIHPFPKQDIEVDRYYFTDQNNPFPFQDVNTRLAAKYFKLLTHRLLPNYDVYVWMDGSFKVKSTRLISTMVERLKGAEITVTKHPHRSSIYQEAKFICDGIDERSPYLTSRYNKEAILRELEFIGSDIQDLYMCGLFARVNTPRVNSYFNEWFMWNIQFSSFDQNQFSKIAQNLKVNPLNLGDPFNNPYYQLIKHSKLQ